MKYKKGTFTTIPNIQYLLGKPSEMQALYLWLCVHADEKGGCYPAKNTLGDEAGCSHNTTDKYIKQLADEGFIQITNRKKKGTNEFMSNHYQILLLTHPPKATKPTTIDGTTSTPINGAITKSNINYIHLTNAEVGKTDKVSSVFSFKEELEKLGESKWVVHKIIHNYWKMKGFTFENKKQFDSAVSRSLRPAKLLEGYTASQINKTMEYCETNYKDIGWTLETVVKRIADTINKKP